MLARRLERLQAELNTRQISCLALLPGANLYYMTGLAFHLMERPTTGFFPAGGVPTFVLPALERSKFEDSAPYGAQIFSYEDGDDPANAYMQAIMALPEVQSIAVEYLRMRVKELKLIQRHVPAAFLSDADPVMAALRLSKSADEIAHMRTAITISEQALREVIKEIRPGMTEREIANRLSVAQLLGGGGSVPFEPLVQAGSNAAHPHGFPGDRQVQAGEMLLIDFGTTSGGYVSDITRTFMIGEPPGDRAQAIYEVVRAANAAGRAAAGPGVPCREVDRAARQVVKDAGFGEYFIHRTGHGIGLEGHEDPSIDRSNETPLEVGMAFTVEPGIYIPGELGIRIEDNVVITPEGAETLTTFSRDLMIIGT